MNASVSTCWLIPRALLVVMPKWPTCMAAYIVVATGLGISLPAATKVRLMLITLCIASLLWLTIRTLHRFCLSRARTRSSDEGHARHVDRTHDSGTGKNRPSTLQPQNQNTT
jgi:hypothetical protein